MPENSRLLIHVTSNLFTRRNKTDHPFQRGFSLIELLVVIAIIAVLATLAAPSFAGLIANISVSRAVNNFIADTRYARGEGMRRGVNVTICRSTNPMATTPLCSAGSGSSVGAWMEGWVVFIDENGNGSFNNGDTVLRVQEPVSGIGNFIAVGSNTISAVSTGNRIIYDGTGHAIGQEGRWLVHAAGALKDDATYTRTLCMNSVGRVRVLTGESAC